MRGRVAKKRSNAVLVGSQPSSTSKKRRVSRKRSNAVLVGSDSPSSDSSPEDQSSTVESGSESPFTDEQLSDDPVEEQSARLPGAMPLVPRTAHVDSRMRKKIRKGEFVNFRSLLDKRWRPRRVRNKREGDHFEEADEDNLPILQWIDAYIVYMSVYLEFFPGKTQGMLRHMQIVKRMCSTRKDGVEYDTQFRRLKAQHSYIEWGEFLPELASEIDQPWTSPRYRQGRWSGRSRRPFVRNKRVCYRFNSKEGCRVEHCSYSHKCGKCMSADHPSYRCSRS